MIAKAKKFAAKETLVCWNENGDIQLFDWPDINMESKSYKYSELACYKLLHDMSHEQIQEYMTGLAEKLVFAYKIPVYKVDKVLSQIEEYENCLAQKLFG